MKTLADRDLDIEGAGTVVSGRRREGAKEGYEGAWKVEEARVDGGELDYGRRSSGKEWLEQEDEAKSTQARPLWSKERTGSEPLGPEM